MVSPREMITTFPEAWLNGREQNAAYRPTWQTGIFRVNSPNRILNAGG